MLISIQITNQPATTSEYACVWEESTLKITGVFGNVHSVILKDSEGTVVSFPTTLKKDAVSIEFPAVPEEGVSFQLDMVTSEGSSPTPEEDPDQKEYYSGTEQDILLLCKSLSPSEGRLGSSGVQNIGAYQALVDEAIDGHLCEQYFVPFTKYNQVQPDGSVKKIFPGKLRLLAQNWVVGLILCAEYQNLAPNAVAQGQSFIEDARKDLRMLTKFTVRLPGQRYKSALSRTFPPNLQPPAAE